MKKYLHVMLKERLFSNTSVSLILTDVNRMQTCVNIFLIKSDTAQSHYNMVIPDFEQYVNVDYDYPEILSDKIDFLLTDNQLLTEEQREYELSHGIEKELVDDLPLYFSESFNGSSKLLVMFPSFVNLASNLQYPITQMKDIQCSKLSFYDRYLVNGTYMLADDCGRSLTEAVVKKIKQYCDDKGILEKNLVFFGTSKGGTIALNIGSYFSKATIVSVVPQMDLTVFYRDTYIFGNFHKNTLGRFLKYYNHKLEVPKILDRINKNRQNCYIFNGENDYFSNSISLNEYQNIHEITGNGLSHNQVIKDMNAKYSNLLKDLLANTSKDSYSLTGEQKYVHFEFHYSAPKNVNQEIIIRENGKNLYRLYPPCKEEGLNGKFYNIVLPNKKAKYDFITTLEKNDFSVKQTHQRLATNEEEERDLKAGIVEESLDGRTIYYVKNIPEICNKLVISFPGFYYHYKELQYTISTLSSLSQYSNTNAAVIAFQDRYFIEGTYMQIDDDGKSLKEVIVKKIKKTLLELGLQTKDLVLFGASKGGTIALSFLDEFPEAQFITVVPQMSLDHYREGRPHLNGTLIPFYELNNFPYETKLDIARLLYNSNDTSITMIIGNSDDQSTNLRSYINNSKNR